MQLLVDSAQDSAQRTFLYLVLQIVGLYTAYVIKRAIFLISGFSFDIVVNKIESFENACESKLIYILFRR